MPSALRSTFVTVTLSFKQAGNGPSRRPAKVKKTQCFLNMQKDTILKISSILQCQKKPEGIRIRLEYHRFPNWKQQEAARSKQLSKNKKLIKTFESFFKMSPVSRIVPKTLRR